MMKSMVQLLLPQVPVCWFSPRNTGESDQQCLQRQDAYTLSTQNVAVQHSSPNQYTLASPNRGKRAETYPCNSRSEESPIYSVLHVYGVYGKKRKRKKTHSSRRWRISDGFHRLLADSCVGSGDQALGGSVCSWGPALCELGRNDVCPRSPRFTECKLFNHGRTGRSGGAFCRLLGDGRRYFFNFKF